MSALPCLMLILGITPPAPGTPAPASAATLSKPPEPAPASKPIEERDFPACPTGTVKGRSVDAETSRVFLYCERRMNGRTINRGPLWTFFPNGQIESRFESVSGRCRHGSERWHANGVRAELVEVRDCGQHEHRRVWYPNGKPRLDEVTDRRALHGARRKWNAQGTLMLEAVLNHGIPEGPWRAWYDNGRLAMLATFADGRPEGAIQWWLPSGKAWPADRRVEICDSARADGCDSPFSHLDAEALPPLRAPACGQGGVSAWRKAKRGDWARFFQMAGASHDEVLADYFSGKPECPREVALRCARDMDGDGQSDLMLSMKYDLVEKDEEFAKLGCKSSNALHLELLAVMTAASARAPHGQWGGTVFLDGVEQACYRNKLRSMVPLPDGRNAILLDVEINTSCRSCEQDGRDLRLAVLQDGSWRSMSLLSEAERCGDFTR